MYTAYDVVGPLAYDSKRTVGTITLDYENRHKRRMVIPLDQGGEVCLDLPKARLLIEGEALKLNDDKGFVRICALAEPLLEVKANDAHHLLRLAWHLGNRHLPAMIEETRILIRQDHVIEKMLLGLEADLRKVELPFNPERGAYHDHGKGHDH